MRKILKYFPDSPSKKHIHVIVKLPLLSLEEALSCISPPITYSLDCITSKTTTNASGDPLTSVLLWGDFFNKVNQFRFDQQLRCPTDTSDIPDFNCHLVGSLMEAKRKYVLEDMGKQTFPEFYNMSKEMQKEVEIYKDLADIQGKYISKLVCYRYYGRDISFLFFFISKREVIITTLQTIANKLAQKAVLSTIDNTFRTHWYKTSPSD
ncbi:hypothetical protein C1646_792219 [Rhizophagus diaphanus]|nr:hypothetical protein C1646_792219 [Rhizophagus diaphanus] [Rhizophagus sp. MUCL 43196]